MPRQYCADEDVSSRLPGLEDRDVTSAIEAVTARIEGEAGRIFLPAGPETRTFVAQRAGYCTIDDVLAVESVTWGGSDLARSLYRLSPAASNRLPKVAICGPWDQGDEISIAGTWGYSPTVPADVRDACVAWVIRTIKAADAAYGDATAIPELGQLVYSKAIPADVRRVCERYKRMTGRPR